jgi:4-amino-4-deoxy-L-arabinose transferase-like glycosyltransferase
MRWDYVPSPAGAKKRRRVSTLVQEWPLVAIVLLAAVARLGWPGLTQFRFDEARISTIALDWVTGNPMPQVSMTSSIGISNPPLAVYLLALPYSLSPDPQLATQFVGLLNVLAVAGCYLLARHWYGRRAAWVSALLFATSPWAIYFSRILWANAMLPPFVVLTIAAGYFAVVEQRGRWFFILPVVASLTAQVHWYGFAIALWAGLILLIFWRRVRWRPLSGGIVAGGAVWTPYLLHLVSHWEAESEPVVRSLGQVATVDGEALRHAWRLITGTDIHSLLGPTVFESFLASVPPYELLWKPLGYLVIVSLIYVAWQRVQGRARAREIALMLLLWIALTVVLFTRHSVPVHVFYLTVLYPAPFLAVGALTSAVAGRHPVLGRVMAVFILVVAISQVAVFGAVMNYVGSHHTVGGMGTPLHYWKVAADRAGTMPVCEVRVIGTGSVPIWDEVPAVFNLLLHRDQRLRFYDAREPHEVPDLADGRTLVVLPPLPEDAAPYAHALEEMLSDLPPVRLRAGEGQIQLLARDGGRGEARLAAFEPTEFANGMWLLDYAVAGTAAPGETVRVFLHWQLIEPPEQGELYVFNHLLDAVGHQRGQGDGYICPMDQWHDGLRVWTWYDIEISTDAPPGPYQLRTGVYRFPEIVNIEVWDQNGSAVGDAVFLDVE